MTDEALPRYIILRLHADSCECLLLSLAECCLWWRGGEWEAVPF